MSKIIILVLVIFLVILLLKKSRKKREKSINFYQCDICKTFVIEDEIEFKNGKKICKECNVNIK